MLINRSLFNNLSITKVRYALAALILLMCSNNLLAQQGTEVEIDKPKKYENRKLGAEKTTDKKISFPKKVYQNTVTHYNYYFNANKRINDLIYTAKSSFKDDYSQLLPFYNYSLDVTSQNKEELDSIIYKCTAGILLHDLRNSWIDNMYLLLGKAYFLKKDLDSAALTFQYLNFSFAPKENGGYDIPIGSNASNDKGEFSIVTKEKNSIWNKLTSRPPSRNESFIWQIRNFIEKSEFPEAAGIIEILRNDPNFPKRLNNDLNEAVAYWFYKQQLYDSSAFYLAKSLENAENTQEKARWEYLIAQMYHLTKKHDEAVKYYEKAMDHTTDPVMDVYARLNAIRIKKSDGKDYLQQNIDELVKMAKKDKYAGYRDIIYYAAASIELESKNYKGAQDFLLKSTQNSTNNPAQRTQSFLVLADMNYDNKEFVSASNFYDSVEINFVARDVDKNRVTARKPPLKTVADNIEIIKKQDSLQLLARLTPAQRDSAIKRQVKLLKKSKGIKDDESSPSFNPAVKQQTSDMFADNSKGGGDFYFYNSSAKSKGFSEFKAKWGDRPNVDNWRRKSAVDKQITKFTDVDDVPVPTDNDAASKPLETSYEGMQSNIPTTPEKMDESNTAVMNALFTLGQTFMSKLEELPSAIQSFEELLRRFPESKYREEAMFDLVYIYGKTGDKVNEEKYKRLLNALTDSKWKKQMNTTSSPKDSINVSPATAKYKEIYNLFIEGNFAQAEAEKKIADSLYGKSYWTPQLLFIESIYYIKIQDDSTAIKTLTDLSTLYTGNPLAERAKRMIDVLKRRKEIERYLTTLQVTRNEDTTTAYIHDTRDAATAPVVRNVTPPQIVKNDTNRIIKDTIAMKPVAPVVSAKGYSFVASDAQYVVVLLDKVDPVYQSEARNAFNRYNKEKFYSQRIDINSAQIDERYNLILQGPFTDAAAAVDYIDKVKPAVRSRILPWLSAEKYSFYIISQANLDLLKTNKDVDVYKQLLQQAVPGKF